MMQMFVVVYQHCDTGKYDVCLFATEEDSQRFETVVRGNNKWSIVANMWRDVPE